jgi:hypothetical protein
LRLKVIAVALALSVAWAVFAEDPVKTTPGPSATKKTAAKK